MSSWMNNLRAFGRGSNPARNQNQPPLRTNTASPAAYSQQALGPPSIPAAPASPSLTATMASNNQAHQDNASRKVPFFFREENAGFTVKGNFMTLAAKPHLVEEGEWLAHLVVEQQRLLSGYIKTVQSEDKVSGFSVCNEKACPSMSAGSVTYTWIDTKRQPINLPANVYIKHIMTWVNGKINDQSLFPTDSFSTAPPLPHASQMANDPNHFKGKTSGFPQRFEGELKNMYKQMFRCYAHLYWQHWLFYYHTSSHRELNTTFMHFINVGRLYDLLTEKDTEPMQPLIDIWLRNGVLPAIQLVDDAQTAAQNHVPTPTSGSNAGA